MKGMNEEKMNKISVKTSFNLALILHTNCSWFWVHCSTSGVYFPTQTCNPTSKKHLSDTCLRTVATDLLANWTAHTEPVDKAAIFIACSPVRRINSTDKHSYIVREYCMLDIPDILAAFTYGGEFMQRKTSGDSSDEKKNKKPVLFWICFNNLWAILLHVSAHKVWHHAQGTVLAQYFTHTGSRWHWRKWLTSAFKWTTR